MQTLRCVQFPVVAILGPLAYLISELLAPKIHLPYVITKSILMTLSIATCLLVWYFIALEIEKRRRGITLFTFRSTALNLLAVVVFLLLGVGALTFGWFEPNFESLRSGYFGQFRARHIVHCIPVLLLCSWAFVFIALSVSTFVQWRKQASITRQS